jgi:hypothetical protein
MPHAKKELNPLWGLLAEPLFQIIAAVGLLLNGVLGLVGKLVSISRYYKYIITNVNLIIYS